MGFSALTAFVIPPEYSARFRPQIQLLFAPVSRPVRVLAGWVSDRVSPPVSDDRRPDRDIREENQHLRAELATLRMKAAEFARRDAELSKLGDAKDLFRRFDVIGADSGARQSILIAGSSLRGLKDGQYALHPGGLVGRVRAGIGGAQVQLITDPAFRVRVRFATYSSNAALGIPAAVLEGAGNNLMVARGLSFADIGCDKAGKPLHAGDSLRIGDYVQVWDSDCPQQINGAVLGRVTAIGPRHDAPPPWAEVQVAPTANLRRLREVMVMVKGIAD